MPRTINDSDILTRFVYQKTQFSRSNNRVKFPAFMPDPKYDAVSVYVTTGLNEVTILGIAHNCVTPHQNKRSLKCRAEVLNQIVSDQQLFTEYDEPPPLHANIKGWPDDKSKHMEIALVLANNAKVIV